VSQQERQRLEQLANNLATFCNDQAVIDSEGWHVRIPLRPDVLPDTTLDMNVSVHWIHMRFATTDADARRLVSLYSDELEQMLQQALTRPRDISIICD
jgi:type III secretion control protein HpaP